MVERGARAENPILPPPGDLTQLVSRPAPVIAHPAWREACDKVLALEQARSPLIAILGPAGSGKTTLLREVGEELQRRKPVIYFSEFSDSSCVFPPDSVVLVDEAERLSSTSLDMLAHRSGVTVIITALPSFFARFVGFREGAVVALPLLKDDEAKAFLAEWMAEFGLPMDSLTPGAWERLIAHCRGVPRLLASLLKLALFVGADDFAPRVRREHVEMAIAVQGGSAETSPAEVAGGWHEDGALDAAGAAPAGRRSEADDPAPIVDEAASPDPVGYASADAAADGERKPGQRARIAGWVTAGVLCVVAVAVVLLWGQYWHLNWHPSDRTLLARDTSGEAAFAPDSDDTRQDGIAAPAGPATTAASTPPNQADQTSSASTSAAAAPPAQHASGSDDTSAANGAVPAIASPAAAGVKLPSGASIRVVVTYAWGDNVGSRRSLELSRSLRADGFNVGDPFPVTPRNAKRGVSFYFVQDEGVAEEITARLGYGAATLVQFSARDGLPRPGTVEIGVGHD